jgi:hypothetical protein
LLPTVREQRTLPTHAPTLPSSTLVSSVSTTAGAAVAAATNAAAIAGTVSSTISGGAGAPSSTAVVTGGSIVGGGAVGGGSRQARHSSHGQTVGGGAVAQSQAAYRPAGYGFQQSVGYVHACSVIELVPSMHPRYSAVIRQLASKATCVSSRSNGDHVRAFVEASVSWRSARQ